MSRSWCIAGFVNIVGSYGVFPSLSCCDELSFSLWDFGFIRLNTFMDLRTLDICLAIEYSWWQWGIVLIHLIYVLALNSRIPRWHWGNLCIGVDARSCLCFSGRNLGALFEVLCVGLSIMNMNLLWCYFSTNSRIDRTERIALCYFSTNSWIDRTERIALRWFRTLQTIYSYGLRLIGSLVWFFIALWGMVIWSNYISIVERLH